MAAHSTEPTVTDFERARALLADQREDEALDWFEIAITSADDEAVKASAAAHVGALLLGFGRPWEVAAFAAMVRQHGGSDALAGLLEASACVQLGDPLGALQILGEHGPVATPTDPWFPCSAAGARATRVRALALAGRVDEARRELDRALAEQPGYELWEALATLAARGVLAAADHVAHLAPDDIVDVFGWLAAAPAGGLDAIADALWERNPGDPRVLAGAVTFAWRLDAERALVWSLRLHEAGVTDRSPLLERAEMPPIAPADRVRAAIIGAPFDVDRAARALEAAIAQVDDDALADLLDESLDAGTGVADALVVGAATSTERCLRLSARLCERGYSEEALAVLIAGLSRPEADDLTSAVFDALVPEPLRHVLARRALASNDEEVATLLLSVSAGG